MIFSRLRPYAASIDVRGTPLQVMQNIAAAAIAAFYLEPALAQSITPDPSGSGVIANAVNWLTGTLLGNVATGVAVLAVSDEVFADLPLTCLPFGEPQLIRNIVMLERQDRRGGGLAVALADAVTGAKEAASATARKRPKVSRKAKPRRSSP